MQLSFSMPRRAAALILLSALAACSGTSNPATPSVGASEAGASHSAIVHRDRLLADALGARLRVAPATAATQLHGWISPDRRRRGKNLIYSGDYDTSTITIFSSKGINPPPKGYITMGLSNPERLFVDKNLNLYATNIGNNSVVIYRPGHTSPSETISNGVNAPTGLTVGGDGTAYCANVGNDTVTEYPAGSMTPSLTITLSNETPENLAVDASNNLYIQYIGGTRGSGVIKVPPGSTSGTDLELSIGDAGALEVDTSGNVIILDGGGPYIDVFPKGQTSPSKQITVSAGDPFELSLNKSEATLYVSELAGTSWIIQTLAYPNGTSLSNKITSNVGEWPLAVSPDNAL